MCQFCEMLEELFDCENATPRQYWLMTELFVLFHGSDVCRP